MHIEITKSATRQKKKLTKNNKQLDELFNTAIDELPKGDIKKLKLGCNEYRLRVGRYRILFSKEKDTITIHAINDRKNSY